MTEPDPPAPDPTPKEPPRAPAAGGNPFAEPDPVTRFRFASAPDSLSGTGIDSTGELAGCLMFLFGWPWYLWLWMAKQMSSADTFHVPPRFGMSAILGITTSLALLFALFRIVDVHPLVYIFSTLLLFIIVVVQMRWGHVARPASIVAGAAWMPLFVLSLVILSGGRRDVCGVVCAFPFIIAIGGFFGYLAGTCAGGFFLLMDMLEKYWERRLNRGSAAAPKPDPQLDDPPAPR